VISELRALTPAQRNTVLASFLGWTLDAFDYFILIYAVKAIAADFHVGRTDVAFAITLTLIARPFGAYVFGQLADRYGRRPILMLDILLFSAFELASAFAPSLTVLLILRTLFGFAMGGEWGLGAALVMESIPLQARGIVSGLLQEGYAVGGLLAAILFGLTFDHIGWRGMFIVGFIPALLVVFIRMGVPESPVWEQTRHLPAEHRNPWTAMRGMWGRAAYMALLMTAFAFFSHGTQDLYPTFLQVQHGFDTESTSELGELGHIGGICGGIFLASLSQRFGRRRIIILSALLALPVLKLWAFSDTTLLLGLGAFAMQFAVQGAWGVVPVHLNELAPNAVRATLPGITYQIGTLVSAIVPTWLAYLAEHNNRQYGTTMGIFTAVVVLVLVAVTAIGPEDKDRHFG
jgi:SHS family lactate transporter-like MFS transporter